MSVVGKQLKIVFISIAIAVAVIWFLADKIIGGILSLF